VFRAVVSNRGVPVDGRREALEGAKLKNINFDIIKNVQRR